MVTFDPPVRTRAVGNVRLTANEPAEIYVTTDDTTPTLDSDHESDQLVIPNDRNDLIVRFFAVDLAGNQSAEQIVLWNIDDQGPSPPTEFAVTLSGNARTVSWKPPQENHLGGVIVARVEGRLNAQPESGKTYAIGDVLAPGITIVDVRDDGDPATATFEETQPTLPGMVRYVGWAFDDLLNYGVPAGDFKLVPLAQEKGKFLLDPSDGSVGTVNKAPDLTFSGNVTFAAGTLTAKISMRNDTTRVLFAPKVFLTTTLQNGIAFSNPDGTFDLTGTGGTPTPFRAYGSALPPGAALTLTWTFTGVAANSTLTVDLDVRDGQVTVASTNASNQAGSVADMAVNRETDELSTGPGGTRGTFFTAGGGITPDGLVILGSHSSATLSAWDLTTGNRLLTTELKPQKAHIAFATLDHSGSHGYALLADGHAHETYRNGTAATTLIRFDTATLKRQGSIELGESRNRDLRMTTDNKFLVVPTGVASTGAILVDLDKFKVAFNLTTGQKIEDAAFAPDNVTVAVGSVGEVQLFDVRTGASIKTIPLPTGNTSKMLKLAFNGNNELWVGRRNVVIKIDLGGDNPPPPVTFNQSGRLLESFDGKMLMGQSSIVELASDGTQTNSFCCFSSQRGHWLARSPF